MSYAKASECLSVCKILVNSNAGKLRMRSGPEAMQKLVDELGIDAEVIGTNSAEHMRSIVREQKEAGADRIAIAGGDGTVHLAIQELAHSQTAIAIIPQGTANNFATAMHLPIDISEALPVLVDGTVKQVDIGRAAGEYFTESAGVGLFADVLAIYGRNNKNVFRGLYAIFKVFLSLHASRVKLTIDGKQIEERAVFCECANTYRIGLSAPVAPGAKVADGQLDIVIFGDLSRAELVQYYRAMRAQLHQGLPKVRTMRGSTIEIDGYRRMPVHCDDRVIATTPVKVEVQPGALKVLVPTL